MTQCYMVNPKNIKRHKVNLNPLKNTKLMDETPKMSKFEKNLNRKIQGEGLKELTDKLKNLNVKDSMKNIRITF
jgi:hypothetical protein